MYQFRGTVPGLLAVLKYHPRQPNNIQNLPKLRVKFIQKPSTISYGMCPMTLLLQGRHVSRHQELLEVFLLLSDCISSWGQLLPPELPESFPESLCSQPESHFLRPQCTPPILKFLLLQLLMPHSAWLVCTRQLPPGSHKLTHLKGPHSLAWWLPLLLASTSVQGLPMRQILRISAQPPLQWKNGIWHIQAECKRISAGGTS